MPTAFLDPSAVEGLSKELQSGRYLNLSKIQGEKKVRFFGEGIMGWEAWTEDNKPLRWELKPSELPTNLKKSDDGSVSIKRFIAAIVWDYDDETFKIINLNKSSVLKDFLAYYKTPEYGDPQGYDLKISKTGSGMDTEYTTLALPPKPVSKSLADSFVEECSSWNLAAMFDGDDPFGAAV